MKPSFLHRLKPLSAAALLTASLLGSCATTTPEVPYTAIEAPFIPDASPLRNPRSGNLRELAATLPIYHSGDSKTWVRTNSPEDGEWLTRIGDPVTPVRIKRLPSSPQGAQRISVWIGPSRAPGVASSQVWIYDLERASGGWNQLITSQ